LSLSPEQKLLVKTLERAIRDLNDRDEEVRKRALVYVGTTDVERLCEKNELGPRVGSKYLEIIYKIASEDVGVRRKKAVIDGVRELREAIIDS
jgi:hypothetical protein